MLSPEQHVMGGIPHIAEALQLRYVFHVPRRLRVRA